MITIRVRSVMWFAAGAVVSITLVWSLLAWRVFAAPGSGESTVVAVTPTRVLDTRDPVNLGLAGPFVSATSQKLQITGTVPISGGGTALVVPAGSTGVLLNVTAVEPSANGFVSIRPGDATGAPSTSSLNVVAGVSLPNAVQVALPAAGANAGQIDITFDAYGTPGPRTEILIDIVGYTTNVGIQSLVADIALKANAADVYTRTQIDNSNANGLLAAGLVGSTGTVSNSFARFGTFTVTKGVVGSYTIRIPGFSPGCTRPVPILQATTDGTFIANFGSVTTSCGTGDAAVSVSVRSPAGVATDNAFSFVLLKSPTADRPITVSSDGPTTCTVSAETLEEICE